MLCTIHKRFHNEMSFNKRASKSQTVIVNQVTEEIFTLQG